MRTATTIYDKEGNKETLVGAHANRVYVTLDELPDYVKDAFIAIEDERFYEHDGIDVRGILRAAVQGLKTGDFSEGASTITQQLLKNQVFEGGLETEFIDKVERKIQEQYLAIQLENKLEKDTILEYYLNTINLGAGTTVCKQQSGISIRMQRILIYRSCHHCSHYTAPRLS